MKTYFPVSQLAHLCHYGAPRHSEDNTDRFTFTKIKVRSLDTVTFSDMLQSHMSPAIKRKCSEVTGVKADPMLFKSAGKAEGRQVAGVLDDAPPHCSSLLGTTLSVLLAPPITQCAAAHRLPHCSSYLIEP
ncbi:hypothetical protein JOB18_037067 [Solea senegalensis]|uniref:Uncharacterized protein n=1 Tax=Solea senegalensis TaxID=28829 RepID=A0AAV6Q530_SOLSE|nr:hypothetical protein JOB18_037067 [Solea senegalensis]